MIFPIGDDNIQGGYKPIVSYSLIAINIVVFIIQFITPGNLVCEFAAIPGEIVQGNDWYTIVTSTFMHGGWMHLIGNMLFLWIFADNIEGTIGSAKFLLFYMLGGLFASVAHIYFSVDADFIGQCCKICAASNPCDATITDINPCPGYIPSLGASGAISAVMGAYLVMFPKSRIKMFALMWSFHIPAFMFLLFWIGEQLFAGVGSIGGVPGGGVAWWAHIGGFVIGVVGGILFRPYVGKQPRVNQGGGYV